MVKVVDDSETSTILASIPCDQYTNQSDCENAGCYWCDGACQQTPCGIVCSDYTTQTECEAANCYWYNDACHSTPSPDECEGITTETECIAAGCHWYAYPNPFGTPSCHSKEMLMAYLPFIIAGVGGVIILAAVISKPATPK